MAKSISKGTMNLLRLSGLLFALGGSFHVLRYFTEWEFSVGGFELTYAGSLIIGVLLVSLSVACFLHSKKN